MASIAQQFAMSAYKRKFEEVAEPIIERAIASGMDHNETAKQVVGLLSSIPGFRLGTHILFNKGGELLTKQADDLWSGDKRPFVIALRQVLKMAGPSLVAGTDATADVLERIAHKSIDGVVSSDLKPTADRKAQLDAGVFLWLEKFPTRVLVPARNADGSIRFDGQNVPILLDAEAMTARHASEYTQTTTRQVRQGNTNRPVTDQPKKPNIIGPFALHDAVQMIGYKHFSEEDAKTIKRLLAPKPGEYDIWGPKVWRVLRGYNLALARRLRESGGSDPLAHEESEGLVQTLVKAKPSATLMRELVGEAFDARLLQGGDRDGELHPDDIDALEQVVFDMWLGGEQPGWTKVVRTLRRVRRSSALNGTSWLPTCMLVVGITSPMIAAAGVWVTLFLIAIFLYTAGLTQELSAPSASLLGHTMSPLRFVLATAIIAGWMIFFLERGALIFRSMTAMLEKIIPSWSEEGVVALTRKLRIFGFLLPTINAYLALLGRPVEARLTAVIAVGGSIAVGSMLVDARYRHKVEQAVDRMGPLMTYALVMIPLALAFIWDPSTSPGYLGVAWTMMVGFSDTLIGQLALLAIAAGVLGWILSRSQVLPDGQTAIKNPLTWVMNGVFGLVLVIILFGAMRSGMSGCSGGASVTPPAPTVTVVVPAPAPFSKAALCADPKVHPDKKKNVLHCP
ncbi:hypothetical protein HQ487_05410 [Candidatus Uhrbacteria bacterium]|nr:hypothetical protein [Candidatus Uhrbacteria bacterium]